MKNQGEDLLMDVKIGIDTVGEQTIVYFLLVS